MNIELAYYKASKRKKLTKAVLLFRRNSSISLSVLQQELLDGSFIMDNYKTFYISEPKLRLISAASFRDRIVHHAIMNVLEPVFEKQMIYHTYACRKEKGMHRAVLYAFRKSKSSPYFLKLDVRKYFDSINHDILKNQLFRIIKDKKVLCLLYGIIDSYHTVQSCTGTSAKGLPIGNLTSQYFANLYLSSLDHFILEKLKPLGYVRYMDDFVLWAASKSELTVMHEAIIQFVKINLDLTLKPAVINTTYIGVPFLGYRASSSGIFLLQKTRRRIKRNIMQIDRLYRFMQISEQKAAERVTSVLAAKKIAVSNTCSNLLSYSANS